MDDRQARYVEDVALYWEAQGLPRIAGRIVGWLMICDPPHRTARQLADDLGASKASVSTMTRLLLTSGSIEAVPVPGERATHYALTVEGIEQKLVRRVQSIVSFADLARQGMELVEPENAGRLSEIASLYTFLERELPALLARWHEERGR